MGAILASYRAGRPRDNLGRRRPRFMYFIWRKNI